MKWKKNLSLTRFLDHSKKIKEPRKITLNPGKLKAEYLNLYPLAIHD